MRRQVGYYVSTGSLSDVARDVIRLLDLADGWEIAGSMFAVWVYGSTEVLYRQPMIRWINT